MGLMVCRVKPSSSDIPGQVGPIALGRTILDTLWGLPHAEEPGRGVKQLTRAGQTVVVQASSSTSDKKKYHTGPRWPIHNLHINHRLPNHHQHDHHQDIGPRWSNLCQHISSEQPDLHQYIGPKQPN